MFPSYLWQLRLRHEHVHGETVVDVDEEGLAALLLQAGGVVAAEAAAHGLVLSGNNKGING